jgi:hypothetical protein
MSPFTRFVTATVVGVPGLAGLSRAQTLTWDPTQNPTAPAGGNGTWTADAVTPPLTGPTGQAGRRLRPGAAASVRRDGLSQGALR